jgi:hypothetical protein
MSYCVINGQPVFLHSALYKLIQEHASKMREAAPPMAGPPADMRESRRESRRVGRTVYEFLRKQWEADPVHFHTNWASFDINGDGAVRDVWDLLNDYCEYYKHGYLPDLRNAVQQLADDFAGGAYEQSKVPVFALNHLVKPPKWWWKYTRKTDGRIISLVIVTKNVYRLVGDLKNFAVFTTDFRLNCGPNFGVYPVAKEKEPEQPQ